MEHLANKSNKTNIDLFCEVDCLEIIVCTFGSKGAQVQLRSGEKKMVEIERKVEREVDTTGAGDCFLGAFAAAWIDRSEGKMASFDDLCDFVRKANNAASISVENKGTQSSYPTKSI